MEALHYHSIYLHYPKGIVKAADGETEHFSYYQVPEGEMPGRMANCVIPATKPARKLLRKLLEGKPSDGSNDAAAKSSEPGAKSECQWTYVIVIPADGGDPYLVEIICTTSGGDETAWPPDDGEGRGGTPCADCGPGGDPNEECPPNAISCSGGGGYGDPCSTSGSPDYCYQTVAERLADMVAEDPFVLMDVPCGEIPKWAGLAQHDVPQEVTTRLQTEAILSGSEIQRLEDAAGAVVNMDKFAVTVPGSALPNGWSPDQYLDHIRTHINDYIDTNISQFDFYPGLSGEAGKWENDPLGTVFSIQLTPDLPELFDEDGSVVATGYHPSYWIFSTLYTTNDGYHPVSGNRRFGFTDNGDGTYTFYTRGVDRLSTNFYDWTNWMSGGLAFDTADDLWDSLQQLIASDVGSEATVHNPVTYRPDYEDVQAVLSGNEPPSSLADCQ